MSLSDRLWVLRDEILNTAESGTNDPPGSEIFDAIFRAVLAHEETSSGLDLTLHDALSRRLAWGEGENDVLASTDYIFSRLVKALDRAFEDSDEERMILEIATEVVCATARIVTLASLGKAGRERTAKLREELAQRTLEEAYQRQLEEIEEVTAKLQGFKG